MNFGKKRRKDPFVYGCLENIICVDLPTHILLFWFWQESGHHQRYPGSTERLATTPLPQEFWALHCWIFDCYLLLCPWFPPSLSKLYLHLPNFRETFLCLQSLCMTIRMSWVWGPWVFGVGRKLFPLSQQFEGRFSPAVWVLSSNSGCPAWWQEEPLPTKSSISTSLLCFLRWA